MKFLKVFAKWLVLILVLILAAAVHLLSWESAASIIAFLAVFGSIIVLYVLRYKAINVGRAADPNAKTNAEALAAAQRVAPASVSDILIWWNSHHTKVVAAAILYLIVVPMVYGYGWKPSITDIGLPVLFIYWCGFILFGALVIWTDTFGIKLTFAFVILFMIVACLMRSSHVIEPVVQAALKPKPISTHYGPPPGPVSPVRVTVTRGGEHVQFKVRAQHGIAMDMNAYPKCTVINVMDPRGQILKIGYRYSNKRKETHQAYQIEDQTWTAWLNEEETDEDVTSATLVVLF